MPLAAVDVLICNAGSEIWYSGSGGASWREDLEYERHVDHCWDKAPLKRVLAQALSQRNLFGASVVASVGAAAGVPAATVAPLGAASPAQEAVQKMVRSGSLVVTSNGQIGLVKRAGSVGALGPLGSAMHRVASGVLPREDRPKIRVYPDSGPHHVLVTMTKPGAPAKDALPQSGEDQGPARAQQKSDQQGLQARGARGDQAQAFPRPPLPKPSGSSSSSSKAPLRPSAFATAAAQLAPAGPEASAAAAAAAAAAEADLTPRTTSISTTAAAAAALAAAPVVFDAFADVPALLARLARKFRSCGLRLNVTAEICGSGPGESLRLHLTPLRASRALATTYLALKLQLPFDAVEVVGLPAAAAEVGSKAAGGKVVKFAASDARDWVAGVQRVVLLEGGKRAGRFGVEVGVYGERVQLLQGQ